jgi:hypothetical protein
MSEEPRTKPGYCSYCDEWTREGVVVSEVVSDSGAGGTIVRHPEHVGLARPRQPSDPRRWPA